MEFDLKQKLKNSEFKKKLILKTIKNIKKKCCQSHKHLYLDYLKEA